MNIFKLLGLYRRFETIQKEKAPMSSKVTSYVSLFVTSAGALGLPTLATNWVHSHLPVYAGFVLAAIILHAVLPSIFSAPSAADQQAAGISTPTQKLGVIMLCALALVGTLPTMGCTTAQKTNVAQQIVNWTPSIQSAVDTILATASLLDPAAAPVFATATTGLDILASGFSAAAKTYLANPTQTNLQLLQTLIVQFQQNVNKGILQAAGIKDPNSQKTALAAINGLATAVNAVLALIQGLSTPAQVKAMASQVTVTLAQVRPYLDVDSMRKAGEAYHVTPNQFFAFEAQAGF